MGSADKEGSDHAADMERRRRGIVRRDRSGRRQLASLASRVARGSRVGRPEHHHAMLMTALDAYADQLAARIDAGESVELAPTRTRGSSRTFR